MSPTKVAFNVDSPRVRSVDPTNGSRVLPFAADDGDSLAEDSVMPAAKQRWQSKKNLLGALRQTPTGLLAQLDPESDGMGNAFVDLHALRRVPWFEETAFLLDGQKVPGRILLEFTWKGDALKPRTGTMTVRLLRGIGLKPKNKDGTSDPYVKLILGDTRHKSKTIMKTLTPVWEEEFQFHGSLQDLTMQRLQIQVWDYNAFHDSFHEATTMRFLPVALRRHTVKLGDTFEPRNGFWHLFRWKDTALPHVATSAELWVPLIVYVAMIIASSYSTAIREFLDPIQEFLDPITSGLFSFMVFSLTFYIGSVLSRYWAQWDCTQAAWGRMDDLDGIGAAYLRNDVASHLTIKRICHAYQIMKV